MPKKPITPPLGAQIKERREKLGLSEEKFANLVGTSQQNVNRIERDLTAGGDIKRKVVETLVRLEGDATGSADEYEVMRRICKLLDPLEEGERRRVLNNVCDKFGIAH